MKKMLHKIRSTERRTWIWLGVIALFLGAFLEVSLEMREGLQSGQMGWFDSMILYQFSLFRSPGATAMAIDLTALGSTVVLTLLIAIFALVMGLLGRRDSVIHMILAGVGCGLLSASMKLFFSRPRPTVVPHLVQVENFSYPSGHSLAAGAVYLTLAILACELLPTRKARVAVFGAAAFLIALIGMSRIYLGVHYPSDVLGGILLGMAWACVLNVAMWGLRFRSARA